MADQYSYVIAAYLIWTVTFGAYLIWLRRRDRGNREALRRLAPSNNPAPKGESTGL